MTVMHLSTYYWETTDTIWDTVRSKHKICPINPTLFQNICTKICIINQVVLQPDGWLNETKDKYVTWIHGIKIKEKPYSKSIYFIPLFDWIWLTLNTGVMLLQCVCMRVYIHVNVIQYYQVKLQRKHFSALD